MRVDIPDSIYAFCVDLFGEDVVSRDQLHNPDAIEISVNLSKLSGSPVLRVELNFYRTDPPLAFMHLDNFDFEYKNQEELALDEMRRYLKALYEGRLKLRRKKLFGIEFGRKLVLIDPRN